MFSYRSILKQAWLIVWKHKYLWFFGLFASLAVAGGSMEYQFATQGLGQGLINGSYQGLSGLLALSEVCQAFWLGIIDIFSQNIIVILNVLTILLLVFALIAVFIWLAISSQAALVDNVKKIITTKKNLNILSIREGLTSGHRHFWSVLGLNVLIKILISFVFLIVCLPLLFMVLSNSYFFVVSYIILFVIFIPIAVSLSLIIKYAISYNVLENYSAIKSLESGWKLFKKNWLISLEVAIILFVINFLSSFILLVIVSILFFPLLFLSILFSMTWLIFLLILLIIITAVIFGSLLTTFQVASWTNLYLHLKEEKGMAKLERIFQRK